MSIIANFPGGGGAANPVILSEIIVTGTPSKTTYMDGETFQLTGLTVTGKYTLQGVPLQDVDITDQCYGNVLAAGATKGIVSFRENDYSDPITAEVSGITVHRKLTSIAVTTNPTKMTYEYGDAFATAGMVVTATFQTGGGTSSTTATVTATTNPANNATLTDTVSGASTTKSISVSYTENGITKSTSFNITINRKKIAVPTWKGTLTYNGSSQSADSATLWNNYDSSKIQIGGTYSGTNANTYSAKFTPKTNYCWNDTTGGYSERTVNWTIARKKVTNATTNGGVPQQTGTLTYNGNNQSPTWNNANASTEFDITGTTGNQSAAGTYNVTFTPKSNYCWNDNTYAGKSGSWSIGKSNNGVSSVTSTDSGFSVSGSGTTRTATLAINASNYSAGAVVAIGKNTTGAVSASSSNNTYCPVSVRGNNVTIKGNGTNAGTYTVTITVAGDTNYNATTITVTVTATYWSWGDQPTQTANSQDGLGDQAWWEGLKKWAASATAAERAACVGKTKRMALGGTYSGSTHLIMRCVGADQDGTGTLAFNPVAALATAVTFGSNAAWIGSTSRSTCQTIAGTCAAKNAIKTVKKGTCPSTESNRNGTPTYNDETVFLLSEREYGLDSYSPISVANSTTSKAECTQRYNAPYSYFDGNDKRIMYRGDAYGNPTTNYAYQWERSRNYSNSNSVCDVNSSGSATNDYYTDSRGLAPAFVIG